jgi:hypothetical protein
MRAYTIGLLALFAPGVALGLFFRLFGTEPVMLPHPLTVAAVLFVFWVAGLFIWQSVKGTK